jgi:hypothetical protein
MSINYGILFSGISITFEDKVTKPMVQHVYKMKVLANEHEMTSLAWGIDAAQLF